MFGTGEQCVRTRDLTDHAARWLPSLRQPATFRSFGTRAPTSGVLTMTRDTQGPENATRRLALKASTLGAAAAASTLLAAGSGTAFAQSATTLDRRKELEGKSAFITGGARGIGLATAEVLANAGANVTLFDIATATLREVQYPLASDDDLLSAKSRVEALGVRCMTFKGDVRDRDALTRAMAESTASFGSLDILVANAGITQFGSIEEFSDEQIQAVLDINLAGVIKTTQAAAPVMRRQKSGRMIFISTALGRMGNELFPIYAASKWGVIG
ncbi:MAG: SDR family NAD(P)-dependent oxidoreductase, partial [Silanimonas sp.]